MINLTTSTHNNIHSITRIICQRKDDVHATQQHTTNKIYTAFFFFFGFRCHGGRKTFATDSGLDPSKDSIRGSNQSCLQVVHRHQNS